MTVKELIEKLEEFDENWIVTVWDRVDCEPLQVKVEFSNIFSEVIICSLRHSTTSYSIK